MKIQVIIHDPADSPIITSSWAKQYGYPVKCARIDQNDPLPKIDGFDFLVVMGGTQTADTVTKECPYFNAKAEINLIREAISKNKKVLGICLGSQLIGEAYGVKYEESPHQEIGAFDVLLTEEGKRDLIFKQFPPAFTANHWHRYMPGLPSQAVVLGHSQACPREIVRFDKGIYGLQCHLELPKESVLGTLDHSYDEFQEHLGGPFIQSEEELKQNNYNAMNELFFKLLDAMAALN